MNYDFGITHTIKNSDELNDILFEKLQELNSNSFHPTWNQSTSFPAPLKQIQSVGITPESYRNIIRSQDFSCRHFQTSSNPSSLIFYTYCGSVQIVIDPNLELEYKKQLIDNAIFEE
jgi:hypothetical protein